MIRPVKCVVQRLSFVRLAGVRRAALSLMALNVMVHASPSLAADTTRDGSVSTSQGTRPELPAWSTAGDDGAGSLWANPANMAFDPDPSWFGVYTQHALPEDGGSRTLAFAGNLGPLGTGVQTTTGPDGVAWWTISSGLALRLDRSFSFGGHLGWQLPDGPHNNFVTGDLSASWRPTHWFGASVAVWNVGRWDESVARSSVVPSVVFRPLDGRFFLGFDYHQPMPGTADDGPITAGDGVLSSNLRIQPGKGWALRLTADQTGRVGGGLELYWGGTGVGGFIDTPLADESSSTASVYGRSVPGTPERLRAGPRVALFQLDRRLSYREATGLFARSGETYLQFLQRLDQAARDPSLEGVVLDIDAAPFSFAQIEELRGQISAMRKTGKKVVVYLDRYPDNRTYYLASAADEILMHPAGDIELIGVSAEMQYFRGALDILGVEPQVAKRSEYKSAPEGLMRTAGSEASREQMHALLDDLSSNLVDAIARDRGWKPEDVRELIDNGPYSAEEAMENRLVDALLYPDELDERLEELFSADHSLVEDYGNHSNTSGWMARRELAVITIDGGIVSGESSGPGFFGGGYTAGADTVVRELDAAKSEDTIKAVVLRVDSPGGSSFASDEIWRAVERVKEAGKPVVVSMGSVAASGGYYVAAGADAIYASPSTITGSIGVYAGPKVSLEGLYDKVGVQTEIYTRGRNAAMWSLSKPMDEREFAALDRLVAHTYAQFKQRVGDGRSLGAEEVEEVARGRVWSGVDAQEAGLVDEIGGFHAAVAAAREKAGIQADEEVVLLQISSRGGSGDEVVGRPLGTSSVQWSGVQQLVRRLALPEAPRPKMPEIPLFAELERWQAMGDDRVWMLMPYQLDVE